MIGLQNYQYSYYKSGIKDIYEKSFPDVERFDFQILVKCDKESNVHLTGILLDGLLVGMQFTVDLTNNITYLMYFAIDENYRNRKIGSKVICNLVSIKENIMLCIERPVDEYTQSRKDFYLRNGFYETGVFIEDSGFQYEFLTSKKSFVPSVGDLENRYRCMTSSRMVWHSIKKSVDTVIKLVD